MPDYESILISNEFNEQGKNYPWNVEYHTVCGEKLMFYKDKEISKKLFCPAIGLNLNLYSCTAICQHGKMKVVSRAEKNDKQERRRPEENKKDDEVRLIL